MKILLIDDEPHVTRAIRQLVPWEELGIDVILEAFSGRDAMQLIEREDPQIVLTDVVMPDLTGLELMRMIRQDHPHTQLLVMSSYNDFEYVRSTLRVGGSDYLLKPLDQDQLIRALRRAVDIYEQQEAQRKAQRRAQRDLSAMSDLAVESLLERFLTQHASDTGYSELFTLAPELMSSGRGVICLWDLDCCYNTQAISGLQRIQLWEQSLRHSLTARRFGYLLRHPSRPFVRILFLYQRFDECLRFLEEQLLGVNADAPYHIHAGISTPQAFPAQFSLACEQAMHAFYSAPASQHPGILIRYTPACEPQEPSLDPESEQAIFAAVLSGHSEELRRAIGAWLDGVLTPVPLLYHLRCALNRYRSLEQNITRQLCRRYSDLHFALEPMPALFAYSGRDGLFSREKLENTLLRRALSLHEQMQKAAGADKRIRQVAHWLEENYAEPFSQEALAARFFMSRDYLSRRFAKEMGVSMVNFLTAVRIRQAKFLMADSNVTIREVAHLVGFEDEKYFSRQFKRIEGITPGEYRSRLGR